MFRSEVAALCLSVTCIACSAPSNVSERTAEVRVQPIPPATSASAPMPLASATSKAQGYIFGVSAERGHGDLALLANVRDGHPSAPQRSNCGPVRDGARFDELTHSRVTDTIAIHEVFNNEANRCIGHFHTAATSHFIATSGLRTLPGEMTGADALRRATTSELKTRIRAAATKHGVNVGSTTLSYAHFKFGEEAWVVTTQMVSSGLHNACTPKFPFVAGLSLYRVKGDGTDARAEMVFDHLDVPDMDTYEGAYAFVDFVWVEGASVPWVVFHRNACECQSFVLVAPTAGRTGNTWGIIEGAHSCTI